MIDLYYWPTPNGFKITVALEELGVPYTIRPVDITAGDQHGEAFRRLSPGGKIPAIVDHAPASEFTVPVTIFESGAILLYLAEKHGRFLPQAPDERLSCLSWLFWQVGGLGPMAGQAHHFRLYAPQKLDYAVNRYSEECRRLYAVLEGQLTDKRYIAGEYSIADMAILPWIYRHPRHGIDLDEFPALKRWYDDLMSRPAVERGIEAEAGLRNDADFTSAEALKKLFNVPPDAP